MMKTNETPHEMSLQEKAICLALTGRKPAMPYPLKEVECADGTVQRIYQIPDADKARCWPTSTPSLAAHRPSTTFFSISMSARSSRRTSSSSYAGARETTSQTLISHSQSGCSWTWESDKIKTEAQIVDGAMSK